MRPSGGVFAASAFLWWGFIPVYYKATAHVPTLEMLAHRVVWSLLIVALAVTAFGWWRRVRAVFAERRTLATLMLSAAIIAGNWLLFIWAVTQGYVLQSSLGYYINPLLSVLLGVIALGERHSVRQWIAVALAAAGVGVLIVVVGTVPWIALTLAGTFALYGLIRKVTRVDAASGLFVETLLVAPAALAYLAWLGYEGTLAFGAAGAADAVVIAASGIVTAVPLMLFAAGAQRLRLATVGFFQYVTPTCHFVLAVFVYGERFTGWHLVTFVLIWTALALYTADTIGAARRRAAPSGT